MNDNNEIPHFLCGTSMGSILLINFILKNENLKNRIDGIILLSPAIKYLVIEINIFIIIIE